MKLLVLGGTNFLGRHLADAALMAGHELTLFNRGQTNPELFPEAEHLRGDRDGDLTALEGRRWDAVVDVAGYVPRVVRASAELIDAALYVFVSSGSAYADLSSGPTEESPVATLDDPDTEDVQEHYGALKGACEAVVVGLRDALIVRSGLIVGPHDPTDRFTYWPRRIARGGDVLAPGPKERPVQFVDARDLAAWILRMAAAGSTGVYNATGPTEPLSMADFLEACKRGTESDANLVWVSEERLVEAGVGEWMELPLWISSPESLGMGETDVSRAIAVGLAFRPVEETVRDTLAWDRERGQPPFEKTGLAPERERDLIARD